ncbi:unnamed protein product [Spirodela intermedia]|uniref:BHLH domain-containing protein n=1 Tax=Spirodela intermedia TaxID=51605 RepID=A0A7I8JDF1_SPIIN|nr:unnamed protein product [Spirodela intermedia]CAA6668194.1 unnamed protein product [Spirodela intermedia]
MEEKRIFEWPSSSFLQPPSEENLVIRELIERLRTVSIPAEPHPTVLCCAADGGGGGGAIALNSVPEGRLRVGKSSTGFADSGGSGGSGGARLSGGGRKRKEEEEEDGGAARGQSQSREKSSKPADAPKQDFIHVRARRGQATDSHSLAERVRREKIRQRMKFLQDLVPGCSKMTGKAVMLDEIINYVQSLQRQVEFLSMKLATVNPRLDLNLESLLAKDVAHLLPQFPHGIQIHRRNLLNVSKSSSSGLRGTTISSASGITTCKMYEAEHHHHHRNHLCVLTEMRPIGARDWV